MSRTPFDYTELREEILDEFQEAQLKGAHRELAVRFRQERTRAEYHLKLKRVRLSLDRVTEKLARVRFGLKQDALLGISSEKTVCPSCGALVRFLDSHIGKMHRAVAAE